MFPQALRLPILFVCVVAGLAACTPLSRSSSNPSPAPSRQQAIPTDAAKMTPDQDLFPPVLHSDAWQQPIPMPGPINTAGGEDSPFITPDGQRFFFFFTPDVSVPAEKQVLDGVTGIWWSRRVGDSWTEPQRVLLSNDLALDGCPCALGDVLWFCSARAENYREVDVYTAEFQNGVWTDWKNAGKLLNQVYGIGEFHINGDGSSLFFDSSRPGGYGGRDLWVSRRVGGEWAEPVNLGSTVNSAADEYLPFVSTDGNELWFSGTSRLGYPGPAVFHSLRTADGWAAPEEIISRFAAEPTLDAQRNIYFVHHYFTADGKMVEADIFVAQRR
jgi:hypothetical protein